MEKKNKKSIIIGMTVILLVTLTLLGLTYAYYRTRIVGNPNEQSLSVTSKKLEITYSDGELIAPTDGFEPGKTIEKSFSVENTGEGKVTYAVYLEDVVNTFKRYEDLEMTLMLNGTDVSENSHYPRIDGIITTQEIDVDEVQNYTLTIYYKNELSINQSEDMGKTISGKLQLYDITNTVKEGTLSSKILANAKSASEDGLNAVYRAEPLSIPAQETTIILEQKDFTQTEASTTTANSGYYYTYAAEVEFNPLSGYSLVNPKVDTWANILDEFENVINDVNKEIKFYLRRENGLATAPIDNAGNFTERTQTIKDMVAVTNATESSLTYKMLELTPTEESIEQTLSGTLDDYGISYYYRGDVDNNYVEFNNMCWRIVRIEGDGSVKLTLASQTAGGCKSENLNSESGNATYARYSYSYDSNTNHWKADYIGTDYARKSLNEWFNDSERENKFDTSKLKEGNWCLGNVTDAYSYSAPYNKIEDISIAELTQNKTPFLYETYARLYRHYPEKATVTCNNGLKLNEDYVGLISADEVVFAGSRIGFTSDNYLFDELTTTGYYFTLSIASQSVSSGTTQDQILAVTMGEKLTIVKPQDTGRIRPVISLNNTVELDENSGNGTINSPYIIKEA